MKKWGIAAALVFLLAAIIIGCSADNEEIQSDFMPMLEGKVTPDSIRAASEYLDQNIGKTDQEIGSQMVLAYEDYLLRYLSSDVDWAEIELLAPYWNSDRDMLEYDKIQTEEAKALYGNLSAGGFKFIYPEGMVNPIIDYKVLEERYGKYITEALDELYVIKSMESERPMAEDAGLMITWDELAARAYAVEQYIQTFREDPLTIDDAQFMYENYINTMLLGMNNTPAFNYETKQFSEAAKAAYSQFIKDNPNSVTSWMLTEYRAYLETINYTMDYKDPDQSKKFFDTCSWLVSETGKKALE